MTWNTASIKLAPAQEIFGGHATILRHDLGHYEARLKDGTVLQSKTLTDLCKGIVNKLAGRQDDASLGIHSP